MFLNQCFEMLVLCRNRALTNTCAWAISCCKNVCFHRTQVCCTCLGIFPFENTVPKNGINGQAMKFTGFMKHFPGTVFGTICKTTQMFQTAKQNCCKLTFGPVCMCLYMQRETFTIFCLENE